MTAIIDGALAVLQSGSLATVPIAGSGRVVDGRPQLGSGDAAAKTHAPRAEIRRVSRLAMSTCKPSASRVERRARSAEEVLHGAFRRHSRPMAVAQAVMGKAAKM